MILRDNALSTRDGLVDSGLKVRFRIRCKYWQDILQVGKKKKKEKVSSIAPRATVPDF